MTVFSYPTRDEAQELIKEFLQNTQADSCKNILQFLDIFQESPLLLDPLLDCTLRPLLSHMASIFPFSLPDIKYFHVLYQFVCICGMSTVHNWMPTQLSLVNPVYTCLISNRQIDCEDSWKIHHGLYVWAIHLSKIPFPIFDILSRSNISSQQLFSFLSISITTHTNGSKEQRYASELLAKLISISLSDLPSYIHKQLFPDNETISLGSVLFLHFLIRNIDALPKFVHDQIQTLLTNNENDICIYKRYKLKILTRVCNNYPQLKSIKIKLFPLLLDSLDHRDIRVRWTAIKCIVKFLNSKFISDEFTKIICDYIKNTLNQAIQDPVLSDIQRVHSCILLISEIIRCGLPYDNSITSIVLDFAFYEKQCGHLLLGASIRESCCYFAWCLSRINTTNISLSIIVQIFVAVALTDRALSCRRAAAAVLQEWIGRKQNSCDENYQMTLELVHFYSVSNLDYCMTELLYKQNHAHQDYIIERVLKLSCISWDEKIRHLAADCCGIYVSQRHEANNCMHLIMKLLLDKSVCLFHVIHGILITLGSILEQKVENITTLFPKILEYLIFIKETFTLTKIVAEGWLIFLFRIKNSLFLEYCKSDSEIIQYWINNVLMNCILNSDEWDMPSVKFSRHIFNYTKEHDMHVYQLAWITALKLGKSTMDPIITIERACDVYRYHYYNIHNGINIDILDNPKFEITTKVKLKRALIDVFTMYLCIFDGAKLTSVDKIAHFIVKDCLHDNSISNRHGDISSHCRYMAMISLEMIHKIYNLCFDDKLVWLYGLLRILTDRIEALRWIALQQLKTISFHHNDVICIDWLSNEFLITSDDSFYQDIALLIAKERKITNLACEDECLSWILLGWMMSVYGGYEGDYYHAEACIDSLLNVIVDRYNIGWNILETIFKHHMNDNDSRKIRAFLFLWNILADVDLVRITTTSSLLDFLESNFKLFRNNKHYWNLIVYYDLKLLNTYSQMNASMKQHVNDQYYIMNQLINNKS